MDLLEIFKDTEDVLRFQEGSVIFREGEHGDFMYVILEGEVQFSLRDAAVGSETRGGMFGEMALLDDHSRSATAIAMSDCVLVPIDSHSFRLLIQHTPDFALHVLNVLAERVRLATNRLAI